MYGDASPLTLAERYSAIVTMLLGTFYFGYVVGSISSVIHIRTASTEVQYAGLRYIVVR